MTLLAYFLICLHDVAADIAIAIAPFEQGDVCIVMEPTQLETAKSIKVGSVIILLGFWCVKIYVAIIMLALIKPPRIDPQ